MLKGTKSDTTFLLILLTGSLAANVFQAFHHKKALDSQPSSDSPTLTLGTKVPPLHIQTLDGRPETITYTTPIVMYVFTPSCPWCQRNLNNVKQLARQRGTSYRFIGISLDRKGLDAYIRDNALPFPVFVAPDQETQTAFRLGRVPQTIVISEIGTVLGDWRGAYGKSAMGPEVEAFFNVKLPGL